MHTLVLLFILGSAGAQEKTPALPAAPVLLSESESKTVQMSNLYAAGSSACDAGGNLYFNTASDFNTSSIMKLMRGGEYFVYKTPHEQEKSYFVGFRVNLDGIVYVLNASHTKLYLYEFSSDTSDPRRTELDMPAGLEPTNFLVLPRGDVLVDGYFTDSAPSRHGQSYLGHFAASGRLLHESSDKLSDAVSGDIKSNLIGLFSGAAAIAENGRGYLLSGNDVLVLSTEGLVDTFHLTPPQEGFRPLNIFVVGGRIVVAFINNSAKTLPLPTLYELLDASTGKEIRTYKPADEMGNNLVCFSKEGFTFLRVEVGKGRLKLISAKP